MAKYSLIILWAFQAYLHCKDFAEENNASQNIARGGRSFFFLQSFVSDEGKPFHQSFFLSLRKYLTNGLL